MLEHKEVARLVARATPFWQRYNTGFQNVVLDLDANEVERFVKIPIVDFVTRLPRSIRVSGNIKTAEPSTSGEVALQHGACCYPWVSLDGPQHRNALILDIDHQDGLELAGELPQQLRPHIVVDPWSARAAAIFMLEDPHYVGPGASKKSKVFFDAQAIRLAQHFRATVLPHGTLTKNPFGMVDMLRGEQVRRTSQPTSPLWDAWKAIESPFLWCSWAGARHIDLHCVRDHFQPLEAEGEVEPPRLFRFSKWNGVTNGRNDELFHSLRFWAYADAVKDFDVILQRGQELNQLFPTPLPVSEIAAIARSIAKYMRTRWAGTRARLTAGETKARQAAAGRRSADLKKALSIAELKIALYQWPSDQKRTQAAVAAATGLSLRTVKTHWEMCRQIT